MAVLWHAFDAVQEGCLQAPEEEGGFFTKVFAAAAQGCTAALVAAILSAMCEPLVNRWGREGRQNGQRIEETCPYSSIQQFFKGVMLTLTCLLNLHS